MTEKNKKPSKPRRLDLCITDVKLISDCSTSTAQRKITLCRVALGRQDHQSLTIKDYCDYYGYNYADVLNQLNLC